MPYFVAPMHPQQQQRAANYENSLDPLLQALFSGMQPQQKGSEQRSSPKPEQQQTKASSGCPRPATKPKPTPKNFNSSVRAFTPNFDVYETNEAFFLEGDLPGLTDKKAIEIEFSDDRTLMVRGQVKRSAITADEEKKDEKKQITENGESEASEKRRSLKPTVEDTDDEESDGYSVISSTSKGKEVEKKDGEEKSEKPKKPENETKVWVSERTFGKFQRTFSFPTPVDLDTVEARLDNGVLKLKVPKRFLGGARKIEVQ